MLFDGSSTQVQRGRGAFVGGGGPGEMIVANEDPRARLKGQDDQPVTNIVGKKTHNCRLETGLAKAQGGGRWECRVLWDLKRSQAS